MTLTSDGRTLNERLGHARIQSRDISELIGLCKGVLADGVVNHLEALFILGWLEDNRSVVGTWPASVLYEALDAFLEDGKLSPSEEGELLGLLMEITGIPVKIAINVSTPAGVELQSVERTLNTATTLPLHEPDGQLTFADMNFVLTGNFMYGSRKKCMEAVIKAGGIAQKGINKQTNYLVIGEVGSECWAQSSFGRKIEKAVYMRESGHQIYIVSENTWRKAIDERATDR